MAVLALAFGESGFGSLDLLLRQGGAGGSKHVRRSAMALRADLAWPFGIELFEKDLEFLGAGDEILCRQQYWVVAQVRAQSAVEGCGAHGSVLG